MFVKIFKMKKIVFIILFFISLTAQSQYTILLLSGDKLYLKNYKYNETGTAIAYHEKSRELQEIDLEHIFSITDTLGNEQIIYKPDTIKEDYMNVDQMKNFIKGEIEADAKFKCKWCLVGGFAIGAASPFLLPFIGFAPMSNIVYSPLVPAASSTAIGFTGASDKTIMAINPELAKNEHYVMGFKERSGQIKLKSTIIGSGIGLLVGMISSYIYYSNNK